MAEKFTAEELRKFEQGWEKEMLEIWREKLIEFNVRHTGSLYSSLEGAIHGESVRTIVHRFLEYGIYVAAGTGRGYYHGNPGDLKFKDKEYRREHKLGATRIRRPWWNPRYYASLMKLNDVEGEFYGEMYRGALFNVIKEEFYSALGSYKSSDGFKLAERLQESLGMLNG